MPWLIYYAKIYLKAVSTKNLSHGIITYSQKGSSYWEETVAIPSAPKLPGYGQVPQTLLSSPAKYTFRCEIRQHIGVK